MNRKIFALVLLFFGVSACGVAPTVPPARSVGETSANESVDLNTEQAIERYLSGRELDEVEGVWIHDENAYEIVIAKNSFGIETDYDYIGIITRSERGRWKRGEIKILMRETASPSLFTGVWFMGDKTRQNLSFVVENSNLIKANFAAAVGDTYLIRTYPKSSSTRAAQAVTASGTGFFVSPSGLVLTNNHVIDGAEEIFVTTSSGDRLKARVMAQSSGTDLALLQVPYLSSNYLELTSAGSASIGDDVFTIGYPTTDILGKEAKYSEGSINSLSGISGDATFMQISVPIQPGNSGGPLVNVHGKVVGITTSTAAVAAFFRATGTLPQNVNWAVKSDYAAALSSDIQLSSGGNKVDDPIGLTKASTVFIEVTR